MERSDVQGSPLEDLDAVDGAPPSSGIRSTSGVVEDQIPRCRFFAESSRDCSLISFGAFSRSQEASPFWTSLWLSTFPSGSRTNPAIFESL